MTSLNPLFIQKAQRIKLLLTDVDGVMTDGTLSFLPTKKAWRAKLKILNR